MKILWIDLNCSYAHSSLALPALHAQMASDTSVEWDIVSATINENVGMIVDEIYRRRPDILAATAWLFNHEQLMHITSRVKALLPDVCLILGGPEFLGDNEEFLRKNPFVDCVFRGEGEEAFPQWLACRKQPEKWNTIPGLCYLTAEKEYKDNGLARVLNFSGLVPPEESRFFNWSKPFVQLETTRGCFNTCAFCVSGGENRCAHCPSKAYATDCKSFTATASRMYVCSTAPSTIIRAAPKNFSDFFWSSHPTSASIWKFIPPCCLKS